MAEISKPYNVNLIWAADSSAVSVPNVTPTFDDARIKNGWGIEIPPVQDFNFLDKRQDQFNAYLNQHGIPEWDSVTEFQANKSLTQVNGLAYKALKTNININPVGDTTGSWSQAFTTPSDLASAIAAVQGQIGSAGRVRGKLYFMGQI